MILRSILVVLALLSAISFTYYGWMCLYSTRVRREYRRYGIPQFRILNGSLMLLGSGGLVLGLAVWPLGMLAAACLTTMMALGLATRYRLRDPWKLWIPASSLVALNLVVAILFPLTGGPLPLIG